MQVSDHLRRIIEDLRLDSGYPYPDGSKEDPLRAFAYGLAIGTLEAKLAEWERKLSGGSDGR